MIPLIKQDVQKHSCVTHAASTQNTPLAQSEEFSAEITFETKLTSS